ncbi:hypothetical protein [Couchioplanes caeruleus]|uniref:FkbH-like protein n=2 Tax=Couchioplanes caeruleus TaxID=56438 RepID=A0A1K0GEU7_9ACTN|nr:hypothetical protein [Couchioplanes caeruleus]OJF15762.1 FkbH-like protein [Couchioplanes caeruleus subsp. caeruleus]ROP31267.1 D-glyceryl-ACP synthase [Couchioplanes caeruleus]
MTTTAELRRRWPAVRREPAVLTVAMLASYTVDPIVPYLGVGLHDVGLTAAPTVGPFNQIVQQCLDDDGEVARLAPDVLVVAPRFEELWSRAPLAGSPDPETYARDLLFLADTALGAAERWRSCLVFVLPAVPETRPYGVADHGSPHGAEAVAATVRQALRRRLSGHPNVYLADCEAAVRTVGSRHAHHPALFRFAKVPYTDDVFAELAGQITRLLRLRYAPPRSGIVIDADSLLAGTEAGSESLQPVLTELRRTGARVALRGTVDRGELWAAVRSALSDDWMELVDDVVLDERPVEEQLRDVASVLGLAAEQMVVLTAAEPLARQLASRALRLADSTDLWPAQVAAAGLYDSLPPAVDNQDGGMEIAAAQPSRSLSVEEYIAGLDVRVQWRAADQEAVPEVLEMLLRTKDFALGGTHTEQALGEAIADRSTEILLADVRDRLGDYGLGAAVRLRYDGRECVVDLLLVSCPVLGKGVEDEVMSRILRLAADHGCQRVTFRYMDTGRNGLVLSYLREKISADPASGITVRMERHV